MPRSSRALLGCVLAVGAARAWVPLAGPRAGLAKRTLRRADESAASSDDLSAGAFAAELARRKANGGGDEALPPINDESIWRELSDRDFPRISKTLARELESRPDLAANVTSAAPPTQPGPDLTPGDVVTAVLESLRDNNTPRPNHGIAVFFAFMSDTSSAGEEAVDPALYESYIPRSRYAALLNWTTIRYPKKMDMSLDGKTAYQTVLLRNELSLKDSNSWTKVKLTLSDHDGVWLIDNLLVASNTR